VTIGIKKLALLIQSQTDAMPDLTASQRKELAELCVRIFTTEASASSGVSPQRITDSIRTDIANVADRLAVSRT
jgi:hypothetical protein